MAAEANKPRIYTRYPLSGLLIYNGSTALHYFLGGAGIMLGYSSLAGYIVGSLYLVFAFLQMYIIMPLAVCPNCVYYRLNNSLCVSGLNAVSKRIAREGNLKDFPNRGQGILCHNNMYMAALFIPIIAIIPALAMNFSLPVLVIFIAVIGLIVFRMFVVFPRVACIHCSAKHECPNAQAMGLAGR